MGNQENTNKNTPEKKIKYGAVSVAVWTNNVSKDGKDMEFKTVSAPSRNYQDKENKWQTTNSLRKNDVPNAILCLQEAQKYLNENTENQ